MVKILDCSIRDGGYNNNWNFSRKEVFDYYKACSESNIDYFEIGFIRSADENIHNYGEWYNLNNNIINDTLGDYRGCKLSVMAQLGTFKLSDFIPKNKSKISLIRILMAYHSFNKVRDDKIDMETLEDSIFKINSLIDMGYEVSFNIGRVDKISREQLKIICEKLSKTKIKYFYLADTYGTVDIITIENIINMCKTYLSSSIQIGFHAHNNLQDGSSKSILAYKYGASILDGTFYGIGRGGGNAPLELLLTHFNKDFLNTNPPYNIEPILNIIEKYIISYKDKTTYNIIYLIGCYYKCHVNYAYEIINKQEKLSIDNIFKIFKCLKKQNKNMFYFPNKIDELKKII